MIQATRPQARRVVALILFTVLILLVGYFFFKEKPPVVYRVTVDLDKAIRLIPRPTLIRGRHFNLNFYFNGEVVDVSQYQRVEVLNPKEINLKLLEELGDEGLVMTIERRRRGARRRRGVKQRPQMEYKEVPVLEKKLNTEGTPGYFIEVERLERGKRYVLCEWPSRRPHPLKYFFAFTKQ